MGLRAAVKRATGGCRMRELQSLLDFGKIAPALPSAHPFSGVARGFYWSSTTSVGSPLDAWGVVLIEGLRRRQVSHLVCVASAGWSDSVRSGARIRLVSLWPPLTRSDHRRRVPGCQAASDPAQIEPALLAERGPPAARKGDRRAWRTSSYARRIGGTGP